MLKDEIFGHKIKLVSQSQEEQENGDDLLLVVVVVVSHEVMSDSL